MNLVNGNNVSLGVVGALCVCGGIAAACLLIARRRADPRIQESVKSVFSSPASSFVDHVLKPIQTVVLPSRAPAVVPTAPLIIERKTTYSKLTPTASKRILSEKLFSELTKKIPHENLASVLAVENDPRRKKMLINTFCKIDKEMSGFFSIERFRNSYVKKERGVHFAFGIHRDQVYIATSRGAVEAGATKEVTGAVCLNNLEPMVRLKIPHDQKKMIEKEVDILNELHKINNPHLCLPFSCQMTSKTKHHILFQHGYLGSGKVLAKANPKQLHQSFCECAEGLALIHEAGFVQSDFKPANLLIEGKGEKLSTKITDFGTARRIGTKIIGLTGLYAAPETIRFTAFGAYINSGYKLAPACDSFALGATFLHLMQGLKEAKCFFSYSTFEMDSLIEKLKKDILARNIPKQEIALLCGMLSVCTRLLHKSPDKRITCRGAFDFLKNLS